jgi:hypothetical protein
MINRSLSWMLVALGLSTFLANRAAGQSGGSAPLPAGVTECDFGALSNDPDPAGLNVRAAPDSNAAVLGRLLPPTDKGRR